MTEETENLTIEILRSIRDEISGSNRRLDLQIAETNRRFDETNSRLDETNRRLDFLAEGQIRIATSVEELKVKAGHIQGEVHGLRIEAERQGSRFEHFLGTSGDSIRDLQVRVARLEAHTGLHGT